MGRTGYLLRTAFLEITASGFLNVTEPLPLTANAEPDSAVLPSKVTASLKLICVVQKQSFGGISRCERGSGVSTGTDGITHAQLTADRLPGKNSTVTFMVRATTEIVDIIMQRTPNSPLIVFPKLGMYPRRRLLVPAIDTTLYQALKL